MSTTPNRIYLARLAGTAVFDPAGDQVGKIRDFVVTARVSGRAPAILGAVVEVAPRRRIFVPMSRISAIDPGSVVTTGVVNLRRFERRSEEKLVIAEIFDRKVTHQNEKASIEDLAMTQNRLREWEVSRLFIRKGAGAFGRRGSTVTVDWNEVIGLFDEYDVQSAEHLLASIEEMRPADIASMIQELPRKRQVELLSEIDMEKLADVFEELPEEIRVDIMSEFEIERATDLLEEMEPDDAADLMQNMSEERTEAILDLMDEEIGRAHV